MSRTVSPVSGRPYGLAAVCRAWRFARSTAYRHRAPPRPEPPSRSLTVASRTPQAPLCHPPGRLVRIDGMRRPEIRS